MVEIVGGNKAHAEFSASGSHRWLNCPGSIKLSKNYPNIESKYAQEGTLAHECFEKILKGGKDLSYDDLDIETGMLFRKPYPKEMIAHGKDAAKWVRDKFKTLFDAEMFVENRVDASPFTCAGQFGTLDVALVEPFGTLVVIDYKYGAGIAVDPVDDEGELNPQLVYYALAVAYEHKFNFQEVELVVIQPRAFHPSGETTRSVVIDIDVLKSWSSIFLDGVKETRKPDAPLKAGSWCKFCPAAVDCPALRDRAFESAQLAFSPQKELLMPDPNSFRLPDLGDVLTACDQLEMWIEKVRAHAVNVLERGEKIDGWKLVEKKATRKWIDENLTAVEALSEYGEDVFSEPSLLSPAQFEKKFGKKVKEWVAERVEQKSSGTTMVKDTDKRPAIESPFGVLDVTF